MPPKNCGVKRIAVKRKAEGQGQLGLASKKLCLLQTFNPHVESVEEFDGRVCEYIRSQPACKSPPEVRRRNLLLQFSPPEIRRRLERTLVPDPVQKPTKCFLDELRIAHTDFVASNRPPPPTSAAAVLPRLRLQKLHQREGESAGDFVYELEALLAQCRYGDTIREAVAKDRLIIGLRSFSARAALLDLMDRKKGVSYDELRYLALTLEADNNNDAEATDTGNAGWQQPDNGFDDAAQSPQIQTRATRASWPLSANATAAARTPGPGTTIWSECHKCKLASPNSFSQGCPRCGEPYRCWVAMPGRSPAQATQPQPALNGQFQAQQQQGMQLQGTPRNRFWP